MAALAGLVGFAAACTSPQPAEVPLRVPHGYAARLEVTVDGQRYGFGPFVGYYFQPVERTDLSRLRFVCFNENGFYSSDAVRNQKLFEGEAVLTRLPPDPALPPRGQARIQPVFPADLPASWLASRPDPREEFVHFHSCYDARGPALLGYWLRHLAEDTFTYDMGARVTPDSILYHAVTPGPDRQFAQLVEFDRGPAPRR